MVGMIFAGFMNAAKEDRVEREKKEYENSVREAEAKARMEERRSDREFTASQNAAQMANSNNQNALTRNAAKQATIDAEKARVKWLGVETQAKQEQIDAALARDTTAVMGLYQIPKELQPKVFAQVEALGKEGFISAFDADKLILTPGTPSSSQTVPGPAMFDPATVLGAMETRTNERDAARPGQAGMDTLTRNSLPTPQVNFQFSMGPNRPEKPNQDVLDQIGFGVQEVFGKDFTVVVTSGKGEHGSVRHRGGHAADIQIKDPSGKLVALDDPRSAMLRDRVEEFGIQGFGAGEEYMGANTFHLDNYPVERYSANMGTRWGSFGKADGTTSTVTTAAKAPDIVYNARASTTPADWFPDLIGGADSVEKTIAARGQVGAKIPDTDPLKPYYLVKLELQQSELALADQAKANRTTTNKTFYDRVEELNGLPDATALLARVSIDPGLDDTERATQLSHVRAYMDIEQDREVADLVLKAEPVAFMEYGEDGSLSPARTKQVKVTTSGIVDLDGKPVEQSSGVVVTEGVTEDWLKLHNTPIQETVQIMQDAESATRALLELKQIGLEFPEQRNSYVRMASAANKNLSSVWTLIDSFNGGEYQYESVYEALKGKNLGEGATEFIAKVYGATYKLAALNGSTGVGLSDKEFAINLQKTGMDEVNDQNFGSSLDAMIRSGISNAEMATRTKLGGMFGPDYVKEDFLKNTIFAEPASVYIGKQLEQVEYLIPGISGAYQQALDTSNDVTYESGFADPPANTGQTVNQAGLDAALAAPIQQAQDINQSLNESAATQAAPAQAAPTAQPQAAPMKVERVVVSKAMAAGNPALADNVGDTVEFSEDENGQIQMRVIE